MVQPAESFRNEDGTRSRGTSVVRRPLSKPQVRPVFLVVADASVSTASVVFAGNPDFQIGVNPGALAVTTAAPGKGTLLLSPRSGLASPAVSPELFRARSAWRSVAAQDLPHLRFPAL